MSEPGAVATGLPSGESPTRLQINTTDQTAIFPREAEAKPRESLGNSSERQSLSAHRAAKPLSGRTKLLVGLGIAVLLLVGGYFGYRYLGSNPKQIDSIAVMPFVNESGNSDVEYLGDGITETLITSLSKLSNLNVKPRSTVFRYKGKVTDPHILGTELKVGAILYGRVVQRGQDVELFVELIDVNSDKVIWSEQYRRRQSDIASLQADIARDLSGKLRLELSVADRQTLSKKDTSNPEAYQLYLRGRYEWNKFSLDGLTKSIEFFERAVQADPTYARAYSGLADSYINLGVDYVPPADVMPKARVAAIQAIALDDSLAEAHTSLGSYKMFYEWDIGSAEEEYRKAIRLDVKYANARHFYSHCLQFTGREAEAIREMKAAVDLEPLSLVNNAELGWAYYLANQHDAAIEQLRKTIELDPSFSYSHFILGLAFAAKGDYVKAVGALSEGQRLSPDWLELQAALAYTHALAGDRREAEALLARLLNSTATTYINPVLIAAVYAALRDNAKAIAWLERGYREKGSWMRWIAIEPQLALLRPDPRFQDLVSRVNK
ncbi:MAG: tetratricopeptide repeat protein [Blastocatellia bacterium]|nr:tetratricopeptide repeat protein [Blastocatellia bacterium]